jgi:hypothetical protein
VHVTQILQAVDLDVEERSISTLLGARHVPDRVDVSHAEGSHPPPRPQRRPGALQLEFNRSSASAPKSGVVKK